MRFLILSDVHLEFAGYAPPPGLLSEVDAIILAGDIMPNVRKLPSWVCRPTVFGSLPVLMVLGNHEFYGGQVEIRRRELLEATAHFPSVHVLDPGDALLDGGRVRVLGCTLWTDFEFPVLAPAGPVANRTRAMAAAGKCMNDYARITVSDPDARSRRRPLAPKDTLSMHQADRKWLLEKLGEPFDGETIVISHHGPSAGSVAPRWTADWLTPSFSSDLPDEFFQVPRIWVHGHTHDSRDYVRGNTRVICNPRGYLMQDGTFENEEFDPRLVVEI